MTTPFRQLESVTSYTADGVRTAWDFTFSSGYLDKAHVKAYQLSPLGARTEIPVTLGMFAGAYQLTISPPIPAGYELTIYRDTPTAAPLVDFTDAAAFTEVALDTVVKQATFAAAETQDALSVASARIDQIGAFAQGAQDANVAANASKLAAAQSATNAATSEGNALASAQAAAASALSVNDTNIVHKAGAETITGVKTFSAQPVGITASSVGLGNVNNTADTSKPVSTAQQAAMNTLNGPRVQRLIGGNNATTPLTKFDLAADIVVLRNAAGATVTSYNAAATCDFGLAGPAVNGRDAAAVFPANSWVHLYFIWNGTTLATLASATLPTAFTGATLPAGYTHWCYATSIRWNASSNILVSFVRGKSVSYEQGWRVLNGGTSTTFTAVSLAGVVPPTVLLAKAALISEGNWGTAGSYGSSSLRPTGSTTVTGTPGPSLIQVTANAIHTATGTQEFPVGTGQQVDYRVASTPSSGGVFIDVVGYSVANGDS